MPVTVPLFAFATHSEPPSVASEYGTLPVATLPTTFARLSSCQTPPSFCTASHSDPPATRASSTQPSCSLPVAPRLPSFGSSRVMCSPSRSTTHTLFLFGGHECVVVIARLGIRCSNTMSFVTGLIFAMRFG